MAHSESTSLGKNFNKNRNQIKYVHEQAGGRCSPIGRSGQSELFLVYEYWTSHGISVKLNLSPCDCLFPSNPETDGEGWSKDINSEGILMDRPGDSLGINKLVRGKSNYHERKRFIPILLILPVFLGVTEIAANNAQTSH